MAFWVRAGVYWLLVVLSRRANMLKWLCNQRQRLRVAAFLTSLALIGVAPGPAAAGEVLRLESGLFGQSLTLRLQLEAAVPYRVFTLDDPRRLVVDVQAAGWRPPVLAGRAWPRAIGGIRAGRMGDGWARLVVDLRRSLALDTAEMRRTGDGAEIEVRLRRVPAAEFADRSGPPPDVWPFGAVELRGRGEPVTIAIDPGHGGMDPGAIVGGVAEKDLMLTFATDLRDRLAARGGYRVVLTREADDFVALDERVRRARAAGADLFLSLHANAEADERIGGAIAFTRAERNSSALAAGRAELENAAGLAVGEDGPPPTEEVLLVLSDMARRSTVEDAEAAAAELVAAIDRDLGTAAAFPLQSGRFAVLNAPDMPSVLLEVGFLSNMRDRRNMTSPDWRERAAEAIAVAIDAWTVAGGRSPGSE